VLHRLGVAGELSPGDGLGCLQRFGASALLEAGRGGEGARQVEVGRGPVRRLAALWSEAGQGLLQHRYGAAGLTQRQVGLPHAHEGTAIEPPLQEREVCAIHGGPGRRGCCGRRG